MAARDVRQLFEATLALPEGQRDAFLAVQCRRDPERHQRVARLLRAHARVDDFLALPGIDDPDPTHGRRVGPFELRGRIGEGGFATVYLARQHEPLVRDVAVKILTTPIDSAQWLARFDNERRVLALMEHPGIARVLDAGTTPDGRPYCAMELVRGPSLTDWCDATQLDLHRRLQLFVDVCRAVQHAHVKGIVHRDLKPDNILVAWQDGRAVPKVIDFGIAKSLHGAHAAPHGTPGAVTEQRQVVGTLQYMSPEQAEGVADIDTRSDVYSLGAVLFELLTGTTPFPARQLRDAPLSEVLRILREEDPPRPSTRLAQADHGARPHRDVQRALATDLDWVVLRCLARERDRRYESVADLAADLERFLSGRPVLAAPPSTAYRARKFLRRHRGHVIAAALTLVALVGGTIGASLFAWRSALREAQTARVAGVLTGMLGAITTPDLGAGLQRDLLAQIAPTSAPSPWTTACFNSAALRSLHTHVFEPALRIVATEFADDPTMRADLQRKFGATMARLGLLEAAAAVQAQVLTALAGRPEDAPDVLAAHLALGGTLALGIEPERALVHARKAWEGYRNARDADPRQALAAAELLGRVFWRLDRSDEAAALQEDTLVRRRQCFGDGDRDTVQSMYRLAQVRLQQRRLHGAEGLLLGAMARLANLPPEPEFALALAAALAHLRQLQGWPAEAGERLHEALAASCTLRAGEHRETMFLRCRLLDVQLQRGEIATAIAEGTRLAAQRRTVLGAGHRDTLSSDLTLALALHQAGDVASATAALRDLATRAGERLGPADPFVADVTSRLATLLEEQGDVVGAHGLRREAVLACFAALPADCTGFDPCFNAAWLAMLLAGDDDGTLRARFTDTVDRRYRDWPAAWCTATTRLAVALLAAGRDADAVHCAEAAVATAQRRLPDDPVRQLQAFGTQANILAKLRRDDEALAAYERTAALHAAWHLTTGERLPWLAVGQARCLLSVGRYAAAEQILLAETVERDPTVNGRRTPRAVVQAMCDVYDSWPGEDEHGAHRRAAAPWHALLAAD